MSNSAIFSSRSLRLTSLPFLFAVPVGLNGATFAANSPTTAAVPPTADDNGSGEAATPTSDRNSSGEDYNTLAGSFRSNPFEDAAQDLQHYLYGYFKGIVAAEALSQQLFS